MKRERMYTVKQTARMLRLSTGTVYRLISSGSLASLRPKKLRRRLIPQSAIDAFLGTYRARKATRGDLDVLDFMIMFGPVTSPHTMKR